MRRCRRASSGWTPPGSTPGRRPSRRGTVVAEPEAHEGLAPVGPGPHEVVARAGVDDGGALAGDADGVVAGAGVDPRGALGEDHVVTGGADQRRRPACPRCVGVSPLQVGPPFAAPRRGGRPSRARPDGSGQQQGTQMAPCATCARRRGDMAPVLLRGRAEVSWGPMPDRAEMFAGASARSSPRSGPPQTCSRKRSSTRAPNSRASTGTRSSTPWKSAVKSRSLGQPERREAVGAHARAW